MPKGWVCFFLLVLGVFFGESPAHFLSFIMPCYNCSKTVEESIESIFMQKLRCPFELICTDDGSSDGTLSILKRIQKRHKEMQIYVHQKNQGGGPARNTCVKHSQGDLIFCLDSDNVLEHPEDVQKLIDFLDQEQVDVACFGIVQFVETSEAGSLLPANCWVYESPSKRFSLRDILYNKENPAADGNYLFTRRSFDVVGGYRPFVLDTFCFGFEQVCHGFPIAYLPNTRYLHRRGHESYWVRGFRSGVLDVEFMQILLLYPELFTDESLKFLKKSIAKGKFDHGKRYYDIIEEMTVELSYEGNRKCF